MAFDTALESELNATLMLIEKRGSKALVVGVLASDAGPADQGATGAGVFGRAVSADTTRRDAEIFIHALRAEADRIERKIGGLTTRTDRA